MSTPDPAASDLLRDNPQLQIAAGACGAVRGLAARAGALLQRLRRAHPDDNAVEEGQGELFVFCSDEGWRTHLARPGQDVVAAVGDTIGETDTLLENLRIAIRNIPPSLREEIGKVTLLVSDASIEMLDNRFARLRTMDAGSIRQFGAQQLGTDSAAYCFIPFGQSSERETPRGVFAFISAAVAREYLAALDTLATKLTRIVPADALLVGTAAEQAIFAFELRQSSSTLMLADPETGSLTRRELAIGVNSLAQAVAEEMSVSKQEAVDGFHRRDCFSALAGEEGSSRALTSTSRALGPVLARLEVEIKESLDYFTFHRMGGAPSRLIVSPEAQRLTGFPAWLARAAGLPVHFRSDLLKMYSDAPGTITANFLDGAADGLLRIGKTEYRYSDGRFRPMQTTRPRRTTPISATALLSTEVNLRSLARFVSRDNFLRALPTVGVIALALGLVWVSWQIRSEGLNKENTLFASALAADGNLRSALARRENELAINDGRASFLWSDKLAAIADAVPEDIALTSLAVARDTDPRLDAQRIVIEGELNGHSLDHIDSATGLVDRLLANREFMRDFRTITFDGETGPGSGDHSVSKFAISIWFDPARRRDRTAPPTGAPAQ